MAVFFLNTCKFGSCGVTFPTLQQLIRHIEETHIDFDPHIVEKFESQQPSSLPLSYVLRVFKESSKKNGGDTNKKARSHSPASSVCSTGNTPTGSEMEDDYPSDSDDSCDSWKSKEDFNPEIVLRMLNSADGHDSKPFACPVPGCKKRYKNVSGIKYHTKNGHNKESKVVKGFKCHCGKSYKTSHGLKTHVATQHCQGLLGKQSNNGGSNASGNNGGNGSKSQAETLLASALAVSETHSYVQSPSQKPGVSLAQNQSVIAVKSKATAFTDEKLIQSASFSDNVSEHKIIKPPPLSPILQQHLLSPVLPKKSSPSLGQITSNGFGDHQYPQ